MVPLAEPDGIMEPANDLLLPVGQTLADTIKIGCRRWKQPSTVNNADFVGETKSGEVPLSSSTPALILKSNKYIPMGTTHLIVAGHFIDGSGAAAQRDCPGGYRRKAARCPDR